MTVLYINIFPLCYWGLNWCAHWHSLIKDKHKLLIWGPKHMRTWVSCSVVRAHRHHLTVLLEMFGVWMCSVQLVQPPAVALTSRIVPSLMQKFLHPDNPIAKWEQKGIWAQRIWASPSSDPTLCWPGSQLIEVSGRGNSLQMPPELIQFS